MEEHCTKIPCHRSTSVLRSNVTKWVVVNANTLCEHTLIGIFWGRCRDSTNARLYRINRNHKFILMKTVVIENACSVSKHIHVWRQTGKSIDWRVVHLVGHQHVPWRATVVYCRGVSWCWWISLTEWKKFDEQKYISYVYNKITLRNNLWQPQTASSLFILPFGVCLAHWSHLTS